MISGAISPLIWVITIVTLLITPLITTHEPPSTYKSPNVPFLGCLRIRTLPFNRVSPKPKKAATRDTKP